MDWSTASVSFIAPGGWSGIYAESEPSTSVPSPQHHRQRNRQRFDRVREQQSLVPDRHRGIRAGSRSILEQYDRKFDNQRPVQQIQWLFGIRVDVERSRSTTTRLEHDHRQQPQCGYRQHGPIQRTIRRRNCRLGSNRIGPLQRLSRIIWSPTSTTTQLRMPGHQRHLQRQPSRRYRHFLRRHRHRQRQHRSKSFVCKH